MANSRPTRAAVTVPRAAGAQKRRPGLAVPHPHQRGFPGFSSRWSSRGAGRPGRHAGTRPHGPSPHFLLSTSAGVGCRATETRPSSTLRTPLCPTRTTEERLTQPGSPQGGHPNCPGSPNCPGHMRCQVWARATDTAAKLRNFLHRRGRRASSASHWPIIGPSRGPGPF